MGHIKLQKIHHILVRFSSRNKISLIIYNTIFSCPVGQQLAENPNSWANDFNMLYIDNPFGDYSFFLKKEKKIKSTNQELALATDLRSTTPLMKPRLLHTFMIQ